MDKATIISIGASLGVIGTAVTTAMAVPKAQERIKEAKKDKGEELTTKEIIAAALPAYIPPAAMCAGTVACILGANALNKKQQASIISSYALLEQCYKRYRDTLIDIHGPAADEEVREHMELQRSQYDLKRVDVSTPDAVLRWYEPISGQWFNAYEREVMDAEYHFNRNFVLGGGACVNELLYFLNLPDMGEKGAALIWDMCCEEIYWVDFEHDEAEDENGIYYIVNPIYNPIDITSDEWKEYYE